MVSATANMVMDRALEALVDEQAVGYAGDVSPGQAYRYMQGHPNAVVVDVRTQPEWQFVGVPDLRAISRELHLISWKHYPQFNLNEKFSDQLMAVVPDKAAPIFFICRSGGRSQDAAMLATSLGYTYSFNIAGGFEGEPDPGGKRGTREGWKAASLPWMQT